MILENDRTARIFSSLDRFENGGAHRDKGYERIEIFHSITGMESGNVGRCGLPHVDYSLLRENKLGNKVTHDKAFDNALHVRCAITYYRIRTSPRIVSIAREKSFEGHLAPLLFLEPLSVAWHPSSSREGRSSAQFEESPYDPLEKFFLHAWLNVVSPPFRNYTHVPRLV